MRKHSARRIVSACIVSAASMAALAVPSAANAELLKPCTGSNIEAQGSSLQAEAQVIWNKNFNESKAGCEKVTVKYTGTSSGKGFKAWNEKHEFGLGFIGTDNTVNAKEKAEIEAQGTGKVLTIPVLQGAVSVVVNLPANCTASSTLGAGKLGLNNSTLEQIYAGAITKWSQIEGAENAGNSLSGAGCTPSSDPIIPIVREDGSGTTHIFKRYLSLIFNGSLLSEDGLNHTWAELSEGGLSTVWPKSVVTHAKTSGGPGLLKEVAETPGSIGYANLADAVTAKFAASGAKAWVEIEDSKKVKNGKTTRKFAEPVKKEESNCKGTVYSNGTSAFPPPTVDSPWNEVTTELISKTYSLCGLTYDLVLTDYAGFTGGSIGEATTTHDYLKYVLSSKGGQKAIKKADYLALPKELIGESGEGVDMIED